MNNNKVLLKDVLDKIIDQRNKGIVAPVDTMGCARVCDEYDTNKNFKILVALMLSSSTKDPTTFSAIKNIEKYLEDNFTPEGFLHSDKQIIHSCINKVGYHNKKIEYLMKCCIKIVEKPKLLTNPNLSELLEIPGIGRKMSYLYLSAAFGRNEGVGTDVHLTRITNRLIGEKFTVEKIRKILEKTVSKDKYFILNNALVGYGQMICKAQKPKCKECKVSQYCCYNKEEKYLIEW